MSEPDWAVVDRSSTPQVPPPPGIVPNFVNPQETLRTAYIAVFAVCITSTVLAVAARTVTKTFLVKKMLLEDYCLIISELGFITFAFLLIYTLPMGTARHGYDISIAQHLRLIQLTNPSEIVYTVVMFLAKLSILLQLKRVLTNSSKGSMFWAFQVLIWANAIFYTVSMLSAIFVCWPRVKLWQPWVDGVCLPGADSTLLLVSAAINVVSDFSILFMPISTVWKLSIPLKKKLIVLGIFAMGLFACIASIMRLAYTVHRLYSDDPIWSLSFIALWACAEITTVILTASFPTLRLLVNYFRGKKVRSSVHNSTYRDVSRKSAVRIPRLDDEDGELCKTDHSVALRELHTSETGRSFSKTGSGNDVSLDAGSKHLAHFV